MREDITIRNTEEKLGFFSKKVDKRSRESMTAFLKNHFRYSTMNGWNNLSSYANNIKIDRLNLPKVLQDKAYAALDTDIWDELNSRIEDFQAEQGDCYTIGTNGRSGGYLVLYECYKEPTGHLSYCPKCRQRNYKLAAEGDNCGVCGGPRKNFERPPMRLQVRNTGIDQHEDFEPEEWGMEDLKNRVDLVQAFDTACDNIRAEFFYILENNEVEEETIYRPEKVHVLKPLHA